MLKKDAIAHFGSEAALARALGIRQQSIQDWGDRVPLLRQLQLEKLTDGALAPDLSVVESPARAAQQSAA